MNRQEQKMERKTSMPLQNNEASCSCCDESSMADIMAINNQSKAKKNKIPKQESASCDCCAESSMSDILALNSTSYAHKKVIRNTHHDHDHAHDDHDDDDHGHSHDEDANIRPLAISLLLFVLATIIKSQSITIAGVESELSSMILYLIAWIVAGHETILMAFKNILRGRLFDEGFLMTIATFGAIAIREYPEAAAVMIFYQAGEYLQGLAVGRSKKSIAEMMNIRPDFANLVQADGSVIVVDPEELAVGDIIQIKAGEKIPVDATIIEGYTSVDNKALTGESIPVELVEGQDILSGAINITGLVKARVNKVFAESTVSKILELVQNASAKKSNQEKFITRFSKVYTPIVVLLAVLLAVIPPLALGDPFVKWFERALIFLVISCPCALVISVPLSFFAGIGGASKRGILFKGSSYIEILSQAKVIMFDKTGTITKGEFEVSKIITFNGASREEVLELAALAENSSNHPIAKSIVQEYKKETKNSVETSRIKAVDEKSGFGIIATIDESQILAGNAKLMRENQISGEFDYDGTSVYIAKDHKLQGVIIIEDQIKADSVKAIQDLNKRGIETIMLTGDNQQVANKIAKEVGVKEVYAELLPQNKVEKIEEELHKYEGTKNKKVAFVGDGINDAPVLARADVGIAMGGVGSDAAIEAADIVLMTDELSKIDEAIKISNKTMKTAKQNITFALGIKIIVMLLGTVGMANMWMAVFADVGVALIAVANSMRVLNTDNL